MTYTISTEPVTREHINRKMLVRDHESFNWVGPHTLYEIVEDSNGNIRYFCQGEHFAFFQALLIADDSESTD